MIRAVVVASTTLQEVLLALKIAFLVLLYLFIWRIVRSVGREQRVPTPSQDSMILRPAAVASASGPPHAARHASLLVLHSPVLAEGEHVPIEGAPVTIGRGDHNDVALHGDDFASARHARIERRGDGVWVLDLDSTNGTYVNGALLDGPRRLAVGDVVRVGETDLRFVE